MRCSREYRRWVQRRRQRWAGKNGAVGSWAFDNPEMERKAAKSAKQRSRRSRISVAILAIFLSACAPVTAQLDAGTGTTKADRCVNYQGWLTLAQVVAEPDPRSVAKWQALVDAACAEKPSAGPGEGGALLPPGI